MNAHTPGRLRIKPAEQTAGWGLCIGTEGWIVARIPGREKTKAEANASRLVAAWNACDGLSTEALERLGTMDRARVELDVLRTQAIAQRDELLEALKDLERVSGTGMPSDDPARIAARAAIKKVEGEA